MIKGYMTKRLVTGIFTVAILAGGLTACGSGGYGDKAQNSASYEYSDAGYDSMAAGDYAYSEEDYGLNNMDSESKPEGDVTDNVTDVPEVAYQKKSNKKIIKTYHYNYETENFDQAFSYLKEQIEAFDGYISE